MIVITFLIVCAVFLLLASLMLFFLLWCRIAITSLWCHCLLLIRIYGDKAPDIIEGVKKSPAVALPIVLKRFSFFNDTINSTCVCKHKMYVNVTTICEAHDLFFSNVKPSQQILCEVSHKYSDSIYAFAKLFSKRCFCKIVNIVCTYVVAIELCVCVWLVDWK